MDFGEVSFHRLFLRPTDLARFPLLISAVPLVCKQNDARLNFGLVAAQVTPPLLKMLSSLVQIKTQNLTFQANVSLMYRTFVRSRVHIGLTRID
jgi:hypothetical protein